MVKFIQSATGSSASGVGISATFSNASAAGNCLVVALSGNILTGETTVPTDWFPIVNNSIIQVFFRPIAPASTTLSFTFPTPFPVTGTMIAIEYSGVSSLRAIDQLATSTALSSSLTTGLINTSINYDAILAFFQQNSSQNNFDPPTITFSSATNGFTLENQISAISISGIAHRQSALGFSDLAVTATGGYSTGVTSTVSTTYNTVILGLIGNPIATYFDPHLPSINLPDPYPLNTAIISIQQVAVTIANGATTGTATISSVNTSTTVTFYGGFDSTSSGTNPAISLASITLTDSVTVTATRNTSDTSTVTVWCTVVQFTRAAVVSVQYGTISFLTTDSAPTATISSVGINNSAVMYLGNTSSKTTSSSGETIPSVTLTNSTTVTATRGVTGTTLTVNFVVIEFQPLIVKSLQKLTSVLNSSNLVDNVTISSVVPSNSIIINGGMNSAGTTFSNTQCMMQLTNATTIAFTRGANAAGARNYQYTVIEFQPNVISSIQRGTIVFATGASATASVNSTSTSLGICTQTGYEASASSTQYNQIFVGNSLTDSLTITAARGTSAAIGCGSAYELYTFY